MNGVWMMVMSGCMATLAVMGLVTNSMALVILFGVIAFGFTASVIAED